jgi:hypothetical protein
MALDPTIALQAQAPSFDTALKPVASLLGIQNAMQEQKSRNIQNEQNQAVLSERNNLRQLFQNPKSILDESGNIDFNKAAPAVMTAAPTQGGQILQGLIAAQNSAVAARRGVNALNDEQRASVGQYIMSLAGKPPEAVKQGLDGLVEMQPGLKAAADHAWKYMLAPSAGDPDAFKNATLKVGQSVMAPPQQAAAITPNVVQTDNGQQIVTTNLNPLAEGGVGSHPIAPIRKQLPPTTPTFDNKTGQPGYLGSVDDPAEGGFDPSKLSPQQKAAMIKADPEAYANGLESFYKRQQAGAAPGRVVSGPPVGAVAGVEGSQASINDHWKGLNDQASKAGTDIGLLQNIKQFAHNAVTGQVSDKESFINGLAARLGMSSADLKKTDTDLLAKNAAMLALTGGNTDAARALAEAANPNTKMNESAIRHAADQIISQKQLSIAQQQFLLPFKAMADQGHPEIYQAAKAKFDAAADPRILQLPNMAPEEVAKMKASMSPKERADFGEKIRALQSLGVVK